MHLGSYARIGLLSSVAWTGGRTFYRRGQLEVVDGWRMNNFGSCQILIIIMVYSRYLKVIRSPSQSYWSTTGGSPPANICSRSSSNSLHGNYKSIHRHTLCGDNKIRLYLSSSSSNGCTRIRKGKRCNENSFCVSFSRSTETHFRTCLLRMKWYDVWNLLSVGYY